MIGVFFGIVTAIYSWKAHIWLYPTGLINTLIYIYLSVKSNLFGEATLNIYYTLLNIYGWILWSKKIHFKPVLQITYSNRRDMILQLAFFFVTYGLLFTALTLLKKSFTGAIPWADAFASASAYTAMLLMTRKKIECWYWFGISNAFSLCLYSVKGYQFTAVQFIVLFVMAIFSYYSWRKKYRAAQGNLNTQGIVG
jgi:nicotinamide mononucleotide transporter